MAMRRIAATLTRQGTSGRRVFQATPSCPRTALLASTSPFHSLVGFANCYANQNQSLHPASAYLGGQKQAPGNRHFSGGQGEWEVVPSLGDSIAEGTIVEWVKNVGDIVAADDVLCVIETDKVSVDIRATKGGEIVALACEEGETVQVGGNLASIDTSKAGATPATSAPAPADAPAKPAKAAAPASTPATPTPAPSASPSPKPSSAPKAGTPAQPAQLGSRTERKVPASRMRQTIAKRLKDSQNTTASLTTFNEIDMSHMMALRNKYKDEFADKHGVKLGFMSAFVKASTAALQKFPDVNAWLEGKDVIYRDYVDISVAVGTPTGLVVPVLRNCETMSFKDVEATIADFGSRARKGQLAMEEMAGGTFTISNGGVYGSLMGTPIINTPQSAILGMHGIFKRPVVVKDEIVIRPMMYVALTYDHRIIDGATAVQFLRAVKDGVEDPQRLLLNL